jgi:hypothetical protein
MDGEGTSNELRCLAQTPRFVGILWASANRGILNKCFEMWWPGTELNRRRQPFQGCALPPELPGHFLAHDAVRKTTCGQLLAAYRALSLGGMPRSKTADALDVRNLRIITRCVVPSKWGHFSALFSSALLAHPFLNFPFKKRDDRSARHS